MEYHIDTPAVQVGSVHLSGVSAQWAEPVLAIQKAAEGQAFDRRRRLTLATALRAIYHRQGYLGEALTGFTHGAPELAQGRILVPVSATVQEGPQYRVRGMHFAGDAVVSAEAFDKMAKLHLADIANEDQLRATLAELAAAYESRGYLRAKVDDTPTLDAGRRTVDYAITVQTGPVFHMGTLALVNLNERQTAEVRQCWPLHEGDVYDAVLVPQFLNRYRNQLHSLDGWSASFMANEHDDTKVVDLVVTFQRGGPLH